MTLTYVTDEVVEQIAAIGAQRAPREACGLLLPPCYDHDPPCKQVIELRNAHEEGVGCYRVATADIAEVLGDFFTRHQWSTEVNDAYFLWHTHPNGTEGPSSGDMRYRIPGVRYLVVSFGDTGRPVAARY